MQATRSLHLCIQYATPTFGCPHHSPNDITMHCIPLWFHFHSTGRRRGQRRYCKRDSFTEDHRSPVAFARHSIASDKTKENITHGGKRIQQKTIPIGDAHSEHKFHIKIGHNSNVIINSIKVFISQILLFVDFTSAHSTMLRILCAFDCWNMTQEDQYNARAYCLSVTTSNRWSDAQSLLFLYFYLHSEKAIFIFDIAFRICQLNTELGLKWRFALFHCYSYCYANSWAHFCIYIHKTNWRLFEPVSFELSRRFRIHSNKISFPY